MNHRTIKIATFALIAAACSPQPDKHATATETAHRTASAGIASEAPASKTARIDTAHYRPTLPPQMMTDRRQRAEYTLMHYWDGYRVPADAAFIASEDTEQLLADFLQLARYHHPRTARRAIRRMMEHAQADSATYAYFCLLADKYLYQPNSPARNEDFYIAALSQMTNSPALSAAQKLTPADRLKQALKNRPGQRATDFAYTDRQGCQGRLSTFRAEMTLLFFFDPDCDNCAEAEKLLGRNETINALIETGHLGVLALYSGTDLSAWTGHLPQMPANWTVAHDKSGIINDQRLYDLPASPGYYLLDHEKRVMLKEPTPMQLVQWLGAWGARKASAPEADPLTKGEKKESGAHAGAGV